MALHIPHQPDEGELKEQRNRDQRQTLAEDSKRDPHEPDPSDGTKAAAHLNLVYLGSSERGAAMWNRLQHIKPKASARPR